MKRKYLGVVTLAVFVAGLSAFYGCSDKTSKTGAEGSSQWETVIDFQYDSIHLSQDSTFAIVQKNNKYGAYYKNGTNYQLICEPKYDYMSSSKNGGALLAKSGLKTEILDYQNKPLFREKFVKIRDGSYDNGFIASVDGKNYGYLLRSGKWLLPADYLSITPKAKNRFIVCRQDNSYDLVNEKNESLLPDGVQLKVDGDSSANLSDNYLIVIDKKTYHQGVIDLEGQFALPAKYRSVKVWIDDYGNTYFIVEDLLDRLSLMDNSGNNLVPPTDCQELYPITKEIFSITKHDERKLIGKTGHEILPSNINAISMSPKSEVGFVRKANDYWLIDKHGNRISSEVYQNISISSSGLIKAQKGNNTGYIKRDGSAYIPCLYDYGDDEFLNELLLVSKNQKIGYLDIKGNVKIDFTYDFASPFKDGYAIVIQGQKLGIINTRGEVVVPLQFEAPKDPRSTPYNNMMVNLIKQKTYAVQKGEKWGVILIKS